MSCRNKFHDPVGRMGLTSVIQFSSRGADNQAWEIQPAGDSFYSLRNVMTGAALEAVGASVSTPVRAALAVSMRSSPRAGGFPAPRLNKKSSSV